jgi:hypothetical protein
MGASTKKEATMLGNYPQGSGIPGDAYAGILPMIRGTWYYVDPYEGNDSWNKGDVSADRPLKTLSKAYEYCVSGRGDGICQFSGGTTAANTSVRVSTALDWTKWGITYFGVCAPTMFAQRARISNTTSVLTLTNIITVSGSNNAFYNLSMFNGGSDATALGCLKVSGDRNYFSNVHVVGAGHATPSAAADAVNLELEGAIENTFDDCVFGTDTINRVGTLGTYDIEFTSGCARNVFRRCLTLSQTTSGQTGHFAIKIGGAGDGINRNQYFFECNFHNYNEGAVSAQSNLIGGTAPNNGKIILRQSSWLGYTALEAGTATAYTDMPAANAAGGLLTVG